MSRIPFSKGSAAHTRATSKFRLSGNTNAISKARNADEKLKLANEQTHLTNATSWLNEMHNAQSGAATAPFQVKAQP